MSAVRKIKLEEKYNYADYLTWTDENERWEIIEGEAYMMSPAPRRKHQKISGKLFLEFGKYLEEKNCEVYSAPFDVRFGKNVNDEDIETVVQPDISVICDKNKLDDKGCIGAPDLIVEILSPSTASRDKIEKLNLYEKYEVKEYWIVEPLDETIMIFKLQKDGKYGRPDIYSVESEDIKVGIFEDLKINVGEVFGEKERIGDREQRIENRE